MFGASLVTHSSRIHFDHTDASIPCFDFKKIEQASSLIEREEMIAEFGNAFRDIGFVAVYAPEISEYVRKATQLAKCYFAQSLDVKRGDSHGNNGQSGYSYKGLETAAGADAPDNKETFFVTRTMPAWPKTSENFTSEEFQLVMTNYLQSLSEYAVKGMRYLYEYLGEIEEIENHNLDIDDGDRRIRLAYYPSIHEEPKLQISGKRDTQQSDEDEEVFGIWAEEHFDLNGMTALARPSRSGLEMKTKEKKWCPIMVPEDYVILNCGDQITKKTAGYIKATKHRVISNDPTDCSARISTILFASLPDQYSLFPFKSCIAKMTSQMTEEEKVEYLKKYPDINIEENLLGRLIEMGSFKDPSEELVRGLIEKGLIRKPCKKLKEAFPQLFPQILK